MIVGRAMDSTGALSGDPIFVEVAVRDRTSGYLYPIEPDATPEPIVTEFRRPGGRFVDVYPGARLRIHGWRFVDCVIRAWTIAQD